MDSCQSAQLNSERIVYDIIQLAKELLRSNQIERVIVGQLFHRALSKYLPSVKDVISYNKSVDLINDGLRTASASCQSIRFWKHRGARDGSYLLPDGTHLNPAGLKKYYNSIRGALLFSIKELQQGSSVL